MEIDNNLGNEIVERSGQNIKLCYQCLKCFVGCPVARYMDIKPNGVIRMIQYGMRDQVLKSHAIWLCVSCMTCGVRCPNEIDMAVVFDTLREMSIEAGSAYESEKSVVVAHQEWVRSIKMWGRVHEVTFFMAYMARSLDFSLIASAPALVFRGKTPFIPRQVEEIEQVRKIVDESMGKKKGKSG